MARIQPPPGRKVPEFLHTAIPNELFDELMPELNGSEFKVMSYLTRWAFSMHNGHPTVSFLRLLEGRVVDGQRTDRGTGLTRGAVKNALKSLREKGLVWAGPVEDPETGRTSDQYTVRVENPYA